MGDINYYLLELDDMVIALNNKDEQIKELEKLLKECKELINKHISGDYVKELNERITKILNDNF